MLPQHDVVEVRLLQVDQVRDLRVITGVPIQLFGKGRHAKNGVAMSGGSCGVLATGTLVEFTETPEIPEGFYIETDYKLFGISDLGLGWHANAIEGVTELLGFEYRVLGPDSLGNADIEVDFPFVRIRGIEDGDFGIAISGSETSAYIWYDEEGDFSHGSDWNALDDLSAVGRIDVDFSAYGLLA